MRGPAGRGRLGRRVLTALVLAAALPLTACSSNGPNPNATPIPSSVRMVRDQVFARPDGTPLKLTACVQREATAKLPVLVLVHSGSWNSGDHSMLDFLCAEGAVQGFAAFTVDYRLLPAAYPDQLDDVASAISWIDRSADRFDADTSRIALLGTSAGAAIVSELLTGTPGSPMKPSDFTGGAMLSGIYDFSRVLKDTKSQEAQPVLDYAGCDDEQGCTDRFDRVSAAAHVSAADPPMFLANSTGEIMPSSQMETMSSALRSAGVRHEAVFSEGGNHAEYIAFYDRSVDQKMWAFLRSTVDE